MAYDSGGGRGQFYENFNPVAVGARFSNNRGRGGCFGGANTSSPQAYLSDMNGMEYGQEEGYYEQPCDSTWYVDS